jgi:hypothetical protein
MPYTQSMSLSLVRVLIPTWRFFEESGSVPVLFIRTRGENGTWTPWEPGLRKNTRKWASLFLNAQGNLFLAQSGLVEQVVQEINGMPLSSPQRAVEQVMASTSYQLVKNLASYQVLKFHPHAKAFQFRISTEIADALVSLEYLTTEAGC